MVRNVGIGSSSVWVSKGCVIFNQKLCVIKVPYLQARIGPMIVPYIMKLKEVDEHIPFTILGLVALFGGFLTTFLPETGNRKLPDTIEEGELMGKNDTLWSSCGCRKKEKQEQCDA